MISINNLINGKMQPASDGAYIDNYMPSTGQIYGRIAESTAADLEQAVAAAEGAFPLWSSIGAVARSKYIQRLAEYIEQNFDAFAEAESMDSGKPISLAKNVEIPRAISNLRFFAGAVEHFGSESHYNEQPVTLNYTLRRPIGVVGCISPWNLPLYLFTWKIAPALATGNCLIAKPSEITPYTACLLAEASIKIGLPAGVLNILNGTGGGIGQGIVAHKSIKAISFTGGTATGAHIARVAAPMFKKLSLELGGKNPTIIFADCDYNDALATTVQSAFSNQGQICLCGSRIFVEASIYEQFKADFLYKVSQLEPANPLHPQTRFGALVSAAHLQKVLGCIEIARSEGGTILCGGIQVQLEGELSGGYYLAPTVIEGLAHDCRTNQEEIFGPVVTLTPFTTESEVLAYANSVQYGLAANVWTQNLARAHRVAEQLECGIVWTNCWLVRDLRTPFGGMKQSGIGREGGVDALRFFTEAKNVCIKY